MKLIRAIVRPESEKRIVEEFDKMDLGAMTKVSAFGQGKQKSQAKAPIEWDEPLTKFEETPKVMLMIAVEDGDVKRATDVIMKEARTGNIGDGKIFISPIDQAFTVSTKASGL